MKDCLWFFIIFCLCSILNIQCIFLTIAIGNCMVKLIPPVNFCSDEKYLNHFWEKVGRFLNYRID
jgi:hypothetical protein